MNYMEKNEHLVTFPAIKEKRRGMLFSFVLKVDDGEPGLSIDEEEISIYYSSYIIFIFQRTGKSAKADFTLMDDGHSSHYSTQQTDSDEVPPLANYSNRKGGNR